MKLISAYVLRQWWRSFIIVLLIVLSIFLILTLSEELGDHGVSTSQGFLISFLQTPLFIQQIMPGCCLIGTTVCLALLDRSNELPVMRNIGAGYLKILSIVCLGGILPLAALIIFNNEWLTPHTQALIADLRDGNDDRSAFFLDRDNLWFIWRDTHVHAKHVRADGRLHDITIFQYEKNRSINRLKTVMEARNGVYNDDDIWALSDIRLHHTDRKNKTRIQEIPRQDWHLPHSPDTLADVRVPVKSLPLPSLINRSLYSHDITMQLIHVTALWSRLLQPLLLLLMAALAFPLTGITQGMGSRITLATLAILVWYTVNQLIQYIGITQQWPAWLTIATPFIILIVFILRWSTNSRLS